MKYYVVFFFMVFLTKRYDCFARTKGENLCDISYVTTKYEHTLFGKQHLFYPAQNPRFLVITFSGSYKHKYLMWSWFWNSNENWQDKAYLFLKDDDLSWYVGDKGRDHFSDYANLINHYMKTCNIKPDQVITVGTSMGGYGAILYATKMNLKAAIAINPQINKASIERVNPRVKQLSKQWQDLDSLITSYSSLPIISLVYGKTPYDYAAGNALLDVLKKKKATAVIRWHDSTTHTAVFHVLTKEFINTEIDYLSKQIPLL